MKKILPILSLSLVLLVSCQPKDDTVYILYDNDVHCAVDGYEQMAALRADYLSKSLYVNVVSSGDFVQGNTIGSLSKGRYIISIMNSIPYDIVTLGNHEFDYGVPQMKKLMFLLHAKCVCCNFSYLPTGKDLYPAYTIRQYGSRKVAFVGVATPTTMAMSVPTNFQDKNGNVIYTFHKDETIQLVQQAVNAAREEGADNVIILSHLGDDTQGVNSVELIEQTTGIDAVLDGHQHHVLNLKLANAEGDSVILTSTGSAFQNIGCLTIALDGTLSTELIPLDNYKEEHPRVRERIDKMRQKVQNITDKYIGFSEVVLTDANEAGERQVRMAETNLGDFAADAMRAICKADIGIVNGGGLRHSLKAGNLTYGDIIQVFPFNNTLYTVKATGAQIKRAMEISVFEYPVESGGFMQVSGLRYTFNSSVPTSVHLDEDGICDSIGESRRLISVEIEKDGEWMPIDDNAVYTIGGQSYNLVCSGSSGMYIGTEQLPGEHMVDADALVEYIHMLGDTIRASQYGTSQNRIIRVTDNQIE